MFKDSMPLKNRFRFLRIALEQAKEWTRSGRPVHIMDGPRTQEQLEENLKIRQENYDKALREAGVIAAFEAEDWYYIIGRGYCAVLKGKFPRLDFKDIHSGKKVLIDDIVYTVSNVEMSVPLMFREERNPEVRASLIVREPPPKDIKIFNEPIHLATIRNK